MAKSRMANWLLAFVAAGAQAAPGNVLIGAQIDALRSAMRTDCPPAADAEEIVVCGSREQRDRRHRLPLPAPRIATSADQAGGEQRAAMAAESCLRLCSEPVQIDIIKAVNAVAGLIRGD